MITNTTLKEIAKTIILHQQMIIGPLAIEQANKVPGISVSDKPTLTLEIKTDDSRKTLDLLIKRYEELFGKTSIEVCKDALKEARIQISDKDIPEILK